MSALTDTDLTVLEGLDEPWPCEPVEGTCTEPAAWIVTATKRCECRVSLTLCAEHLKTLMAEQEKFGNWFCGECGTEFALIRRREIFTIDRIEAL